MDCAVSGAIHLQRFPVCVNRSRRHSSGVQCGFDLAKLRQSQQQQRVLSPLQRHLCSRIVRHCTVEQPEAPPAEREQQSVPWTPKEAVKFYVSGEGVLEAPKEIVLTNVDISKTSLAATIVEEVEGKEILVDGDAADVSISEEPNMFEQVRQIFAFAGPALGIWLSGPIMSLIDTSVVGTTSSLQLAALGPGTVMCDGLSYVFMFLSVATSNLIATSLANKDEKEAANHLARLLFVAFGCGMAMLAAIRFSSSSMLQAFVGAKNSGIVPAAATYVNIRAWAWPAVLVTMVAQSASLGMQDSWSPLKVLLVASLVNAFGDILLCTFLGYGIAGAAWATALSQYVAGILMLTSLKAKGYNPLAIVVPSFKDILQMIEIAAPVLMTMLSKICFYTTITYFATSLGPLTLGAHQVMIGIFTLFSVCGEPLAQTAQSFMPELISGKTRNFEQARTLLKTLLYTGAILGFSLASIGVAVPFLVPQLFTNDSAIVAQMHSVAFPFFWSIVLTPPALSLEGTLLAGRDLGFLGLSMTSCFVCGSLLMKIFHKLGLGLNSCWWTLVLFQSARLTASYTRLHSSKSILKECAPAATS
ncbi:protein DETOXIFICATION 46, chloroplastic [Selaginella moellendorffii]|uniref:protein DETOXIFICATION 46, chloroplastic n=1 Tax=Selaginella moellendorffii TaxID=88036 RepID=UPI000D1C86E1|nr:protein DETOXIFICATION 46, chloroplastic [Selaginella moellendorffii]|eukprot:XP_024542883.1 protein DETOXIFICATION 46, chloroplastic [Selaginella moellendorffii]